MLDSNGNPIFTAATGRTNCRQLDQLAFSSRPGFPCPWVPRPHPDVHPELHNIQRLPNPWFERCLLNQSSTMNHKSVVHQSQSIINQSHSSFFKPMFRWCFRDLHLFHARTSKPSLRREPHGPGQYLCPQSQHTTARGTGNQQPWLREMAARNDNLLHVGKTPRKGGVFGAHSMCCQKVRNLQGRRIRELWLP